MKLPKIPVHEFSLRRQKVLNLMKPQSLAIFSGNRTQFASKSVFYPFRQDPDFTYLTNFNEPDSALVLAKFKDSVHEILFLNEKNEMEEKWEGKRLGTSVAAKTLGINNVQSNVNFPKLISKLLKNSKYIYGSQFYDRMPLFVSNELVHLDTLNSDSLMSGRLVKSTNEIDCLRKACEISGKVYNKAFEKQFKTERELQLFLQTEFMLNGCSEEAYYPVVAGGKNALTIHYVENNMKLKPQDMVLVDAAGRYENYCADISRTWPVSLKFTPPQLDLYMAVLETQKECIAKVSPETSLYDLHLFSETSLLKNLKNIGLDLSRTELSVVYPHMIGHHLGLDVHDYEGEGSACLQPNMVITIEPGVYIPETSNFPKHFHNIGIRIEDDIAVASNGYENLSIACDKEPV